MRSRWLGAAGVLALVACALFVLPASAGSGAAKATAKFHGTSKNGVYIVRLADLPAVAYDGGVAGYTATKPKPGQKLDPNSADVTRYVGYLKSKHDEALSFAGGATKLYDYSYSLNGFAAKLSEQQAIKLSGVAGVLSVEPDLANTMDTLTTPAFLGLSQSGGTWDQLGGVGKAGENVVVGILDTGVWPENPAFSDRTGAGPNGQNGKLAYQQLPGWHGKCTPGEAFNASMCNQKLIGAQFFVEGHGVDTVIPEEYLSPRDFDGHGSHTASTAAGNNGVQVTGDVPEALKGRISGMAPRARISMYKVCWELPDHSQVSCFNSDATAAIDQAVADGVDVINYSISGTATNFLDSVEVAWLFAEDAGVFVAASAGNSGPTASTVAHPSPWITTVAASTHNRAFQSTITLGNGATYTGVSVTAGVPSSPIILSTAAGLPGLTVAQENLLRQCYSKAANGGVALLDPAKVSGKIVVCDRGGPAPANARVDKPAAVQEAGGVGTIIANVAAGAGEVADIHVAPAVHVNQADGDAIKAYVSGTAGPTASFTTGIPVLTAPAPAIAGFSSRGPSRATFDQIKPDISAPGVDILAAVAPPNHDGRSFDLESGTSMSSPHIAGLAALIMQGHRDWTPDMVKSAMMTTAYDLLGAKDPFASGAGHVQPTKFLDPGLVYKSGGFAKYLGFICGVVGPTVSSSCPSLSIAPNELNLPSMAVGAMAGTSTLHRTVTNVSTQSETYTASVQGLTGIDVALPADFTVAAGSTATYAVTFTENTATLGQYAKGFITLTGDKGHVVRIPVVVRPLAIAAPIEFTTTGTGDATYGVTFGFNSAPGAISYASRGLVAPFSSTKTIDQDPLATFDTAHPAERTGVTRTTVDVGAGSSFARFSLFDADTTANDLDLFVYRVNADTTETLVGSSSGPSAEEQVQLAAPAAATYAVYVEGFDTGGPTAQYTLYEWTVPTTSAGNMSATGPTTATVGATGTVTLHFTGLAAGTRYLGAVDYLNGATPIGSTIVHVNS